MYDTKNLLLNHVIEASGLRAEFGSYSINGHLSDFKNYLVVLFVGGVWMIWWNYKMWYHDEVLFNQCVKVMGPHGRQSDKNISCYFSS